MSAADLATAKRDTDADWRELGQSNPYWGVISHPKFLSENLTPERIEEFYASGADHIDPIVADLTRFTGSPPGGRALDFGCGVGRLAETMLKHADQVTGIDVSPGMLALARGRGSAVAYVSEMPDGPFDWINSFIVFQHIPPERGLAILSDLLARLAPGGAISLQLTGWRDENRQWPELAGWRKLFENRLRARWARDMPLGQILMYDYDLSKVLKRINQAGIETLHMVSTNHDGHHGVIILGRKTAEPYQS